MGDPSAPRRTRKTVWWFRHEASSSSSRAPSRIEFRVQSSFPERAELSRIEFRVRSSFLEL